MKSIQQLCASIISSRDDPSSNWRGHAAGYLDKRSRKAAPCNMIEARCESPTYA